MSVIDEVRAAHRKHYGAEPRLFAAPGRVNLIGEHTDYNAGFALPMAIDRWTIAAASPNDSDAVRVHSLDFNDRVDVAIDEPFRRQSSWYDYAGGVVAAVSENHSLEHGIDVTVRTDLPIGGGLSSSASFEIALALAILSIDEIETNSDRLAAIGRRAEHAYVGVRSGVMDQLAVVEGVADSALFIDCRTLAVEPVAMPAGVVVVVMDTLVRRSLATSGYNERRTECESGVRALQQAGLEIDALRDVTPAALKSHGSRLASPVRERVRHVVDEGERTKAAVAALAAGDVVKVGRLMNDSQESLRDLYEASVPELDALVSLARQVEGVHGARMTGGGFGGCAIALVDESAAENLIGYVSGHYYGVRGVTPAAFVARASAGAREIHHES